jgi:hypothetical protein
MGIPTSRSLVDDVRVSDFSGEWSPWVVDMVVFRVAGTSPETLISAAKRRRGALVRVLYILRTVSSASSIYELVLVKWRFEVGTYLGKA